jgi:hypothetical protein
MKKLILISLAFILISCGPSQKDKDIAAAACSEILLSSEFDADKRIKVYDDTARKQIQVYNDARIQLGMRPTSSQEEVLFVEVILRLGNFDSCMNLFFPPPPPTRAEIKAAEAAEAAEAARLKREAKARLIRQEKNRTEDQRRVKRKFEGVCVKKDGSETDIKNCEE